MFTMRSEKLPEIVSALVPMPRGFRVQELSMDMRGDPRPKFYNDYFIKWGLDTGKVEEMMIAPAFSVTSRRPPSREAPAQSCRPDPEAVHIYKAARIASLHRVYPRVGRQRHADPGPVRTDRQESLAPERVCHGDHFLPGRGLDLRAILSWSF